MFEVINQNRNDLVSVLFDGKSIKVPAGVSVAAALLIVSTKFRTTPISGSGRGPYCMMGVCFDCLVKINGVASQRACMTTIKQGMRIETQQGALVTPLSAGEA